jgi:hypothetical protein
MERAYIPLRLLLDRQRTILETNGRRRHDDATNDEQNADDSSTSSQRPSRPKGESITSALDVSDQHVAR